MKITKEMIHHIEKALGIKLFDQVVEYLVNDGRIIGGRRVGRTVAYCIKLALSEGEPFNLRKPEDFSDYGDGSSQYARYFFRNEFMKIRQQLKDYGFPVRDVIE